MRKLILFSSLFFVFNFLFAQNEGNIWYFGAKAGLDFNSGSPVALTNSSLFADEGCATMSDNTGNLLFYTRGDTVWNRNHQFMPNGTDLMGCWSSSQGVIILPLPNLAGYYYIFTVDCGEDSLVAGLRYSVVQMSLNGGLGDVTMKNMPLVPMVTEKITAIQHANGSDYWIITHEYGTNTFFVHLFDNSGINVTPQTFSIGSVHGSPPPYTGSSGSMNASHDSKKLAVVIPAGNLVEIFDFDNSTGAISNPLTFPPNLTYPYGVEFSPNNSRVYVSILDGSIYQIDLLAGTIADILNSTMLIGNHVNSFIIMTGAMQIGTDGKIYIACGFDTTLAVIDYPDGLGLSCNFLDNHIDLNGRLCWLGLPQIFYDPVIPVDFTAADLCFGDSTLFSIQDYTPAGVDSVSWNFGDPSTGSANFSTLLNPKHLFSSPGTFDVTLVYYVAGVADSLTKPVLICNKPDVDLGNDTIFCDGSALALDAGPGISYLWDDGSTDQIRIVTTSGVYMVSVTNCPGCFDLDTIVLSVIPGPVVDLGPNQIIYQGNTTTLDAGSFPNCTYLWYPDGQTSMSIVVDTTGTFSVVVTDTLSGCSDSSSIHITLILNLCYTQVDFNTWIEEADPSYGNWNVQGGGLSVLQTVNGDPTFYVTPDTLMNVIISGKISVNNSGWFPDDDFVGFVFGFKEPNASTTFDDYDFWLFDWKKAYQVYQGYTGLEGFSLCRVNGNISGQNDIYKYFWGHTNDGAKFQVVDSLWGPRLGWTMFQEYRFELTYTSTRIIIVVDWDTIFDINGCFEAGRFGFYNFSQRNVLYEDFNYRLRIDFSPEESCFGEAVNFISVDTNCTIIPPNLINWTWDFGTGDSSNLVNPTYTFPGTGSYIVKLIIDDYLGCNDSIVKTFNVWPNPDIIPYPTDTVICIGDSVVLTATGANIYEWSPVSGLSDSTGSVVTSIPSVATTYTIIGIDTMGCTGIDSIIVDMNPSMYNQMDFDNVSCFGLSDAWAKIIVNGGTPPMTFAWSSGDVTDSIGNLVTATYIVTVTDYYKCNMIDSVTIVQPSLLVAGIIDSTDVLCFGGTDGTATVFASGGTPGYTYMWSTTPPQSGQTATNLSAIQYFVAVTDTNGCDTTISILIAQPDQLLISILDQDEGCPGSCDGSIIATVTGGIRPYTYVWSAPIVQVDSAVTNLCIGDYFLSITDFNNCLLSSGLINIVTGVPIDATFIANPVVGYAPLDINFTFIGAAAQDYDWDFGDGSTETIPNPIHTYMDEGDFIVTLIINSGSPYFCSDTFNISIHVDAYPYMDIPNAFSPNNDGYNDVFRIETRGLVAFNVVIFNRWGKKIHEWSGIDGFWDGKQNGIEAADGVYFYIIKSLGNDGVDYNKQGSVTIMRGK